MPAMDAPTLTNDPQARRYRLTAGGEEVGHVEYDPVGATSILLKHTEVDRRHEEKGFGSRLVAGVLDDLRSRGMTVLPICPYAMAWIRRHREYLDVVREDYRGAL
jgi:predicted GNAT family acetyltransferase